MTLFALGAAAESSSPLIDCDRACLYDIADQYLEAMAKQDPSRLPLSDQVQFTENSVQLTLGDGLWGTISGKRHYNLKIADPAEGQVAFFEVVEEHGRPAILAGRIRVHGRKIEEVETVVSRKIDDAPFPVTESLRTPNATFAEDIPQDRRQPRARLISIADGYFDTLQLNDGTLFTQFHPDCNRIENGLQTTNNPTIAGYDIAKLGCADQFRKGQYLYDDRVRDRRYPLVDEEKGVVFSAGFIDHSGRIVDFRWTDGTPQKSMFFYPHSYVFLEIFKIVDGQIRQVESVFANVPYSMPSPWR
jgi:hypothetical protein